MQEEYLFVAIYDSEQGAEKARAQAFDVDLLIKNSRVVIRSQDRRVRWSIWLHTTNAREASEKIDSIADTLLNHSFADVGNSDFQRRLSGLQDQLAIDGCNAVKKIDDMMANIQTEKLFAMGFSEQFSQDLSSKLTPGRSALLIAVDSESSNLIDYLKSSACDWLLHPFKWDEALLSSIVGCNVIESFDAIENGALLGIATEHKLRPWYKRLLGL